MRYQVKRLILLVTHQVRAGTGEMVSPRHIAVHQVVKGDVMADSEKELDTPFADWVRLYNDGEITPAEFVSEMEFDGFDGDLIDFL